MKRISRRGQGLAEYGLILVIISLLAMQFSDAIGQWVVGFYNGTTSQVDQVSNNITSPPPDPTTEPPVTP